MFKMLICGGRTFDDYSLMKYVINNIIKENNLDYQNIEIISGHCSGADKLAEMFAKEYNTNLRIFEARWSSYGRAAGPIRNKQMIDYILPADKKLVVGFVNNNGVGTKNTIQQAKKLNIPVVEIDCTCYEKVIQSDTLDEGVSIDDAGNLSFDWSNDSSNDVIKFESTRANVINSGRLTRYYGYRINKNAPTTSTFLKKIKQATSDENVMRLIDQSVEDFSTNCPVKNFDYIITVKSSSQINELLCDALKLKYSDAEILVGDKSPASEATFDEEEFRRTFHGTEEQLQSNIERVKQQMERGLKQKGNVSLANIEGRFHRYIKFKIILSSTSIDNTEDCNVLLVDDIYSSGTTINSLVDSLLKLNFKGTITIFNLIYNK